MPLTAKDLINAPDENTILDGFLSLLIVAGFPVTSWQPGGVARTIARLTARGLTQVGTLLASVTAGGFNSTAEGSWLTLLSSELYDNERGPATFAQAQVQLGLLSALAGPYTLTAGQLWFTWNGRRYRSTTGGNLTFPSTLVVNVQAESPGARYNAPDGALALITPMPGLLVLASVVTTQGTDAEADEGLRARNRGKWSTVASAMNAAGYEAAARASSVLVTRVRVQANTPAPGSVRVTVAGPAGALSLAAIAAVQAALNLRAPLNITVEVVNAAEQGVPLVGTVRILSSHPNSGAAFAQVVDALTGLFAVLPIGGTVRLSDLYQAIETVPGVDSSLLAAPVADVVLPASSVAVPDLTALTPAYI